MPENEIGSALVTIGGLLLIGLVTDALGRRTHLPRVSLMLAFGFVSGRAMLDLIPRFAEAWFPVIADMALVMVGFLLGEKLSFRALREHGRDVVAITLGVSLFTALFVFAGLAVAGAAVPIALLLASVAPATAPAATLDVVRESRGHGRFSSTLLGIVAVDDAVGLLLFTLSLSIAEALSGTGGSFFASGLREVAVAIGLGAAIGVPLAGLTGRVEPGEPTVAEALGGVLLCGGLALSLGVSFLLASMVMGAVVANLATHHERPFHAIEGIEWPFLVLFFVLAGAGLEVGHLRGAGPLLLLFVLMRVFGRIVGSLVATRCIGIRSGAYGLYMGLALMPQAGVALGMALLASQRIPAFDVMLPIVIASTVVFELIGPPLTRWALIRVGEARPHI